MARGSAKVLKWREHWCSPFVLRIFHYVRPICKMARALSGAVAYHRSSTPAKLAFHGTGCKAKVVRLASPSMGKQAAVLEYDLSGVLARESLLRATGLIGNAVAAPYATSVAIIQNTIKSRPWNTIDMHHNAKDLSPDNFSHSSHRSNTLEASSAYRPPRLSSNSYARRRVSAAYTRWEKLEVRCKRNAGDGNACATSKSARLEASEGEHKRHVPYRLYIGVARIARIATVTLAALYI
ncbi:uncharacterized protein MYCFIDRAFT_84775 [Pseudocercospora fijiensis CIRAD86]|uniref:Uncharacterized protein n=1 Tax=Pseudocercospora fijiensis (strain CIRAD86) TaxID=383855 RepID=M2ZXI1_PSEFD|nr:uncharacterized protein MYCFIDRAFT_84775 [Pseudocercospora fijiensis CIRAD86]EME76786.1 hypothetical protein MYCFIDRAFT_84775 [Pseudocercospora fijiensis CIRAD86]